ncbi:MAG: CAP domain-containing protein [Gammaproteobacteria bacterium]
MRFVSSVPYGMILLSFLSVKSYAQVVALENVMSFANQDTNTGEVTLQEDGTLFMMGNRWQTTQTVFTITPRTVLEFEFASDRIGEIHGIGFDEDNVITSSRIFSLAGTQNWGRSGVVQYTEDNGNFQKIQINVGEFYTGENMRLVLVSDNDVVNPENTSFFRNISVTEREESPVEPIVGKDSTCASPIQQALLNAHNDARRVGRQCGDVFMPAAAPLTWSCTLAQAASNHSSDMATNNFFSHTGSDGLSPFDRMTNLGYLYRSAGENISAGYTSVESVLAGWLNSPGHCRNIMNPDFIELGAALEENANSTYRLYWTSDFATPR